MSRIGLSSKTGVEGKSIFSMDLSSITLPTNVKEYYPWAEYFFTYGIVGTAMTKLAQYPVANVYISAPDNQTRDEVGVILRKMKLKEKLFAAGINYQVFGISYVMPLFPIKKNLVCPSCGHVYLLKDLEKHNNKMYRHSNNKYFFKCQNPECEKIGEEVQFNVQEQVVPDISKLNLALWSPYHMVANDNEITGETEWIYTVPPRTAQKIMDNDHFTLHTTPEMYINAVFTESKIRVNKDKLFTFIAPTVKKDGLPIPPMVRAFQSLYLLNKYQSANRVIAEDSLTPMRMLFPVDKGQLGRPQQQVIKLNDWRTKVRSEINKWKADKNYIPIIPVQVGQSNLFGDGKMLVVDSQMKAVVQDILALIGVPIEIIYGGATWSRQNVSSVMLENSFKALAENFQDLLDFVADHINKVKGYKNKIGLRLKVPRLIEAMAENSYLAAANAAGKVSDQTYLDRFNVNAHEERKKVKDDFSVMEDSAADIAKIQANAGIEAQKIGITFQKEQRKVQRIEAIKDQLSMSGVKTDDMARTIQAQKEMMTLQVNVQKDLMATQEQSQKRMSESQMQDQIKMMKANLELELNMLPKQMVTQVEAEAAAMQAQETIQAQMANEAQKNELESFANTLPEEEKAALMDMSAEDREAKLSSMYEQLQVDEFTKTLPPEIMEEISTLPEDDQNAKIRELMSQQQLEQEEAQRRQEQDPEGVKTEQSSMVIQQQKEDEMAIEQEKEMQDIVSLAKAYNKLSGMEKEKFKDELMIEDTTKFSKVKNIADEMIVSSYTSAVLNAESGKERGIWKELQSRHNELVDDVYKSIQEQQMLQLQAKEYAARLVGQEGNPEQEKLIADINESAPEEFKALVFNYYEEFVNAKVSAKEIRDSILGESIDIKSNSIEVAKDIADNLRAMDEETKKGFLENYKYEDPELYKLILTQMGE